MTHASVSMPSTMPAPSDGSDGSPITHAVSPAATSAMRTSPPMTGMVLTVAIVKSTISGKTTTSTRTPRCATV